MIEDDAIPGERNERADAQLDARLAQLERAFGEQSARLRRLEHRLGLSDDQPTRVEAHDGQQTNASTASPAAPGAILPSQPPPASASSATLPFGANTSARTPRATTPLPSFATDPATNDAGASARSARSFTDLEALIGGSWFSWIGIITLALGVGFFLKLAFDNEWVGPTARVLLGAATGIGILVLAERLRARGLRAYAHVLAGGGVLILYFSTYAAFAFYQLIGQLPAFALMIAVTTLAVALAARYDALPIAILGLIGGFLTPVLLSRQVDNEAGLFSYLALLDAGVLALAYAKRWRSLNHLAFWSTVLMFALWWLDWYDESKLWPTVFFLTVFFLLFNALALIYNVVRRRPARYLDISLLVSNASLYFTALYALLDPRHHGLLGSCALLLAAFYTLQYYAAFSRHRADQLLALSYVGAAATFFALAVAVQLNQQWVTIGWAVEGLVLTWIGFRVDAEAPRWAALPVFAFAIGRWFTEDLVEFSYLGANDSFIPLLNRRACSCAVLVAACAGVVWLYRRYREQVEPVEHNLISNAFMLAANVLALTLLSADIDSYFERLKPRDGLSDNYEAWRRAENAKQFALAALWSFYAAAALWVGVQRRVVAARYGALLLLALTAFKLVVADAGYYNAAWHLPVLNHTFGAFACFVAAVWFAHRTYERAPPERIGANELKYVLPTLTIVGHVSAIAGLSLEATGLIEWRIRRAAAANSATRDLRLLQQLAPSLIWAIYGGALLLIGLLRQRSLLRLLALALLGLTICKVFLWDLASLDRVYRIVSFIVLGLTLLAVSFLYQQRQQRAASDTGVPGS